MAILDKQLQLSDKQAVTATAVSTNVIDAGATKNASIGRDLGCGEQLFLFVNVGTAFTAAGAATLQVTLQDSADNSSFQDITSSGAIPVASLVAGKTIQLALPTPTRRYLRVNYTVATGPMLTGTISAHVVDGLNYPFAYPDIL